MQSTTRVALDAMGGDNAPAEVVKGAVDAVNKRNDIKIFLIGQKVPVERELSLYTYPKEQIATGCGNQTKEAVINRCWHEYGQE